MQAHRNVNARRKIQTILRNVNDGYSHSDVGKPSLEMQAIFALEIAKHHQDDRVFRKRKPDVEPGQLDDKFSRFSKK